MNLNNIFNYKFKSKSLLQEALTHSSYTYENNLNYNYERLEFLGDAVLGLIVSEYIVNKYKEFDEGTISKIRAYVVNESSLSNIAKKLNIGQYILLGKGEQASSIYSNESILSDVMEAIIGAIYLDSGYDSVKLFVLEYISPQIQQAIENNLFLDVKGELQKITQKDYGILPKYSIINEYGPDHNKIFTILLEVSNIIEVQAVGTSKKIAEKNAAIIAIKKLKELDSINE